MLIGYVSVVDWEFASVAVEVIDMASFFVIYYSASPTNRRLYGRYVAMSSGLNSDYVLYTIY